MKVPLVNRIKTLRTHYGDLAYNHGMGTTGMPATAVQDNLVQAVNKLLAGFQAKRNTDCCRAYMELGMAIHTLTDSWADGHTTRNSDGTIQWFQDYNEQSLHFHEGEDQLSKASSANYLSAVSQSARMIGQAMGNSPVDSKRFFLLAPGARVGVVPGTEKARFWNALIHGYRGER